MDQLVMHPPVQPTQPPVLAHQPLQTLSPPPAVPISRPVIPIPVFARTFDLAALRVPAEDCTALVSRFRGHLLNCPRVRNIARVTGGDMDPDLKRLIGSSTGDGGERLSYLVRRENTDVADVLLPLVLYREKQMREFNVPGFVKFMNLTKISRSKMRKGDGVEWSGVEGAELKGRMGMNEFMVVELVDDGEEDDDLSGFLGYGFRALKWRRPTTLPLLDGDTQRKGWRSCPRPLRSL